MRKLKLIIPWTSVLLWMILIFCFSAQKADNSSETSGGFAELLAGIIHSDFNDLSESEKSDILSDCQFIVRKTAHFSVYAILGIFSLVACRASRLKSYWLISAGICLTYAVSDELHQYFVQGRSCEFRDVVIDFFGALTGIAGMLLLLFIIRKFSRAKAVEGSN